MEEDIRLVDLVIELVDARTPVSSRNPDIRTIRGNKPEVLILNKADLADPERTKKFEELFLSEGIPAVAMDSRDPAAAKRVKATIREAAAEKIARDRKRGIVGRPVRVMIAGIPNVGKSTLINTLAGRGAAKTGNKPGVTKGRQWIRLNKDVELLDTPGILWPKFEDQQVGIHLAFIGSVKDEVVNLEELALLLIAELQSRYPDSIKNRYQISPDAEPLQVLSGIARVRGCIKKGEELDYARAAGLLLEDFRSGRLGRITVEWAEEG